MYGGNVARMNATHPKAWNSICTFDSCADESYWDIEREKTRGGRRIQMHKHVYAQTNTYITQGASTCQIFVNFTPPKKVICFTSLQRIHWTWSKSSSSTPFFSHRQQTSYWTEFPSFRVKFPAAFIFIPNAF